MTRLGLRQQRRRRFFLLSSLAYIFFLFDPGFSFFFSFLLFSRRFGGDVLRVTPEYSPLPAESSG